MKIAPTLDLENSLFLSGYARVAGMDEVGRGAWAGTLSIGVAVITVEDGPFPDGLADSKMLTAKRRAAILPAVLGWVSDYGVGEVTPAEIDALGVTAALRLAGSRAMHALTLPPDVLVLDGDHNYLDGTVPDGTSALDPNLPVLVRVKGDAHHGVISAASVIAKEHRDAKMREIGADYPAYGFEKNVGYGGAKQHMDAVRELGLTPHHRRSWNIPAAARPVGGLSR